MNIHQGRRCCLVTVVCLLLWVMACACFYLSTQEHYVGMEKTTSIGQNQNFSLSGTGFIEADLFSEGDFILRRLNSKNELKPEKGEVIVPKPVLDWLGRDNPNQHFRFIGLITNGTWVIDKGDNLLVNFTSTKQFLFISGIEGWFFAAIVVIFFIIFFIIWAIVISKFCG